VTEQPTGGDEQGQEPDYRFSLANERTFLAWIRTSLALVATGIGVIGVADRFSTTAGRTALGTGLLLLGGSAAVTAYRRWQRADTAIRSGAALPRSPMLLVLGVGVAAVGVLALVLAVVQAA
jgi:putative membrane protein